MTMMMLKRSQKILQGLLAKGPGNVEQREAFILSILLIKAEIKRTEAAL